MGSPIQLMRKYWNNPTAVLDALEIKPWPSVDEAGDSFYQGQQHRPTTEAAVRGDDARPCGTYSASAAVGSRHQQHPPRPRRRPWLFPKDAAVRIQSAYRGHRVRSGVQRVRALEAEVRAVEMRIRVSLDQLLVDPKESARVNEVIMDVLLRLDGVGGDCRKYRKSVIKKAISLQESLDCLVVGARGGGAADSRGDLTQQLGQREQSAVTERGKDGRDKDGGDYCEHGSSSNSSRDEDDGEDEGDEEEEEEDEEEGSGRTNCGFLKDELVRVVERNTMLSGYVQELLDHNHQQSRMITKLSQEVEDLKRKLHSLGRKRRRSSKGGGAGCGASSSSSSFSFSSGEEGEHNDHKDCTRDDGGRRMTNHHDCDDGNCER